MRKLLLFWTFFVLTVLVNGQLLPGIVASQSVAGGCGGGSDNYGDTGASGSGVLQSANTIYFIPITVTTCGTVSSINGYIGSTTSNAVKAAIYTNNGSNKPGTLVASTNEKTDESANGWNAYTFSSNPSVTSATTYWIGFISGQDHNLSNNFGSDTWYYQSISYASGFPATATPADGGTNFLSSIYIKVNH